MKSDGSGDHWIAGSQKAREDLWTRKTWLVACAFSFGFFLVFFSRALPALDENFTQFHKSHVKSAVLFFEESLARGIRFSLTFKPLPSGPDSNVVPLSSHYLLPDVIVWDPLRQFSNDMFYCPECSPVHTAVHGTRWKD